MSAATRAAFEAGMEAERARAAVDAELQLTPDQARLIADVFQSAYLDLRPATAPLYDKLRQIAGGL